MPNAGSATSAARFGTYTLTSPLAELLGGDTSMLRTEVTKRIWKYIKDHDLQDPSDRRYIICDDRLREIFNQDRISAFKIQTPLSQVTLII